MWDNKYEAEKIEEQQQKYDKLAVIGLKRLKIASIVGAVVLLFHIVVLGLGSPYVLIPAVLLFALAIFGFCKNSDTGFYAFCAALFFCTALWVSDIYKLIVLTLALFGNSNAEVKMWLSFIAMLLFLVSYVLSVRLLFLDENVHTWKSYRRHSK